MNISNGKFWKRNPKYLTPPPPTEASKRMRDQTNQWGLYWIWELHAMFTLASCNLLVLNFINKNFMPWKQRHEGQYKKKQKYSRWLIQRRSFFDNHHHHHLHSHHVRSVGHPRGPKPQMAGNEPSDREIVDMLTSNLLDASPCNPASGGWGRTPVSILCVEASVESKVTHPWQPPLWADQIIDLWLHDYGSWEGLPGPPEVRFELGFERNVVISSGDGAVLEDNSSGLTPLISSLSCHDALLVV